MGHRGRADGAAPLDVRLLVPALVAWAVLAALVAGRPGRLLAVAVGCVLGALLLTGWVPARWRWTTDRVRPVLPVTRLALVTTALVCLAGAAHGALDRAGPVAELATERAVARVEGTVLTEPRLVARGDERPDLVVLTLRVERVTARGAVSTVSSPVVVFADPSWSALSWRSSVGALGRLGPPDEGQDVIASFAPLGGPEELERPGALLRGAELARVRLRRAVDPLPEDARGLIPGLVIGEKKASGSR